MEEKKMNSQQIEGRNAVMEAFRSGKPIDKVYILDGCQDGPIRSIVREAKKHDTILNFVTKERLNQISETGRHQGVIAQAAAYEYAQVEDMLELAKQKGEDPFLILLDNIEDPHNLGAIIRTANLAGAHGVIIPKHRAAGLTATVAKTSAGALNYTPVAKVTNLVKTMEELKEKGLWFVCADMDGDVMYRVNLKGPIGLVIGNEGEGVGRLVKETCDMTAAIPMKGDIDSLNASVAAGVLAYEIVRQRMSQENRRMKMDLGKMTDEQLIELLREGKTEITDYLMEKYKDMVRKQARAMYLWGGENDDLIQEGMIGLFKAVQDYDPKEGASFSSFAGLCVSRQMYTAIKASQRKKHLPLNSYVSIYASASDNPEENGLSIVDTIEAGKESNPELMILGEEYTNAFEEELKEKLSKLERKVLYLHLQGMEYLKIAEFMDKSPKTIDNALQRIKAKARQLLEEKRRSEKK